MKGHKIIKIIENSIAQEVGIEVNDYLVEINNEELTDALDYHFLIDDEEITLKVFKSKLNEEWEIDIEKDAFEDLGIIFESSLMDDYKSCCNKCIFCFIDQLPSGMRETLYFKDDDTRLSFLQGNYVTLTNMKDKDIDRVIKYRLSPINISIHTMNMELRKRMLNNRFADRIKGYMDRLYAAKTIMNGQIVLCKGINDGKELEYTIEALSEYIPYLHSVSVVPVGLSKYRKGLALLEPFEKEDALSVINIVEKYQKTLFDKHGTHFIHAGDEFYFLAGKKCPNESTYDGYLQLENGVGMTRLLIDEFDECYNKLSTLNKEIKLSLVTGKLAEPIIRELVLKLKDKLPFLDINIYPINNKFFGERITVSGLLTGQDIINQLRSKKLGEKLLLPSNLLKAGEDILLDDISVSDIEKELNIKIKIVQPNGKDFINAIIG